MPEEQERLESPPRNPVPLSRSVRNTLKFIRFSHTIFAMPFAIGAMLVAAGGLPPWRIVVLVILAMVFARTAAMAFNRFVDWDIDKRNPRTAGRHKLVSRGWALGLVIAAALAFIATCWFINSLCLILSPVALAIVFFYSLTKRFTNFAQLYLGLALSVAPVGAWLAVTGAFAWPPLILALGVVFWVAGFDTIYATQDVEIDLAENLKSVVTWLGVKKALVVAQVFHAVMFVCLVVFGWAAGLGMIYFLSLILIAAALVYEHRIAHTAGDNLDRINQAFFTSNAVVGAIFVLAIIGDVLIAGAI